MQLLIARNIILLLHFFPCQAYFIILLNFHLILGWCSYKKKLFFITSLHQNGLYSWIRNMLYIWIYCSSIILFVWYSFRKKGVFILAYRKARARSICPWINDSLHFWWRFISLFLSSVLKNLTLHWSSASLDGILCPLYGQKLLSF